VVAGKVEDQAKGPVAFESIVFVINQVRECVLSSNVLSPADFRSPAVLLSGTVDYQMYNSFRDQFGRAPTTGLVVIELSTLGGDPEVARMMGEDVRYHSDLDPGRHFVFLGKAAIYSAGTTFMSFFAAGNRYLTRGTRLMIHERKLNKTLNIDGPLTTCVAQSRRPYMRSKRRLQYRTKASKTSCADPV
jgi:hypothetical protein